MTYVWKFSTLIFTCIYGDKKIALCRITNCSILFDTSSRSDGLEGWSNAINGTDSSF